MRERLPFADVALIVRGLRALDDPAAHRLAGVIDAGYSGCEVVVADDLDDHPDGRHCWTCACEHSAVSAEVTALAAVPEEWL